MPIRFLAVRRVTHEEGCRFEAEYWATRTMEERVIAGWTLAEDPLLRREEDELPKRTGWTLRRVPRTKLILSLILVFLAWNGVCARPQTAPTLSKHGTKMRAQAQAFSPGEAIGVERRDKEVIAGGFVRADPDAVVVIENGATMEVATRYDDVRRFQVPPRGRRQHNPLTGLAIAVSVAAAAVLILFLVNGDR